MSSRLEATSGLWTGLGVALVIFALFLPTVLTMHSAQQSHNKCIEARGNWNNQKYECTFKENK